MRVNSTFTGFFTGHKIIAPGTAILMLAILLIAPSFTKRSDRDARAKHVNLIIRQIGHQLLLQAGDSTSRVLPVTEADEGTFLLKFENDFAFKHDSLMALSMELLPRTQFPSGYTVTVHDCKKASIVYGFQVANIAPDILACRGRSEPAGCYTIEFTLPDFYEKDEQENVEHKKADFDPLPKELKPFKVDPKETTAARKEFNTTISDNDADRITEEFNPFKVDPQQVNSKREEFKSAAKEYPSANLFYGGMLVLFGVGLFVGRFAKSLKPVPVHNQQQTITTESVPALTALGKFLFDVKNQRLLLEHEVISLTDKECKVLELLNQNFGELIPRETLMQKIWIDEGVITGRSLDMFVSKLRKKLNGDPDLRITNVHGKGYKLEIPGTPY